MLYTASPVIEQEQSVPELSLTDTASLHLEFNCTRHCLSSDELVRSLEQDLKSLTHTPQESIEHDDFFLSQPVSPATDPSLSLHIPLLPHQDYDFMAEHTLLPRSVPEEPRDNYSHTLVDTTYDLASRTFDVTCHKIARQHYPEYRRKSPYGFHENWLLQCMFSKSQQILLGMPSVRPTVFLTGDDFMFTPPPPQQHSFDQSTQPLEWREDYEEDYEEDFEDFEDDVERGERRRNKREETMENISVLMQDESSQLVMDENTWMGHGRHKMVLHVVNTDPEPTTNLQHQSVHSMNTSYYNERIPSPCIEENSYDGRLATIEEYEEYEEEEEEEEEEYEAYEQEFEAYEEFSKRKGVSISSALIDQYRSNEHYPLLHRHHEPIGVYAHSSPSSDHENTPSSSTYQSLSNSPSLPPLPPSPPSPSPPIMDTKTTPMTPMPPGDDRQERAVSPSMATPETSVHWPHRLERLKEHIALRMLNVSDTFMETAALTLELAESFAERAAEEERQKENSRSVGRFAACVFGLWQNLFISTESMLGNVGDLLLFPSQNYAFHSSLS
ncbi:hypothetical protein BDF14DRAFT_1273216 [Spinellus fusiger]|nr:hypothetical protein BDF14DRAFT_1273216 [Spinellus fusiger]